VLTYLLTMGIILLLLLGWTGVQQLARAFALRHPELGAYREENGGCGSGNCSCGKAHACHR
jgi:hypothetical protein